MDLLRSKLVNAEVETEILEDWGHTTFVFGKYMADFYKGIARKHILASGQI